jgi:phage baseplate assembly protein W
MSNSPLASGELPWRPEFGSNLYLLRNRQNDGTLADLARTYVVDALARWEPRVRVLGAQIKRMASNNDKTQNVIFIRVRYEIASSRTGSQTGTNTLEATVVV